MVDYYRSYRIVQYDSSPCCVVLSKTIYQAERLSEENTMIERFLQWGLCHAAYIFIIGINIAYIGCVIIWGVWNYGRPSIVRMGYVAYNKSEVKNEL
jgi:hypothetical protein